MKSKYKYLIILALVLTMSLLYSCISEDNKPEVYVAGNYHENAPDGLISIPCYWKNGVKTDLSCPPKTDIAVALSIMVANDKVYIAGSYLDEKRNTIACYWIDEKRIDLPGKNAQAVSIFVANGSIYIAGATKTGSVSTACYWKDGIRTDLSGGVTNTSTEPSSIFVAGDTVYTSGRYKQKGDAYRACYWKNEEKVNLADLSQRINTKTTSIFVIDRSVYVGGNYSYDGTEDHYRPCYWINGIKHTLTSHGGAEEIYSMAVLDNKFHMVGIYHSRGITRACYWVNDERKDLLDEAMDNGSGATSIFLADSVVYIAGNYKEGNAIRACYWKNGKQIDLPGGFDTWAYDIYVN